jgi:hypothetical protein
MIAQGYRSNFETLRKAFKSGDVALLECTDAKTGATVIAICTVRHDRDGSVVMSPFAKMFDGNPFEELLPPAIPKSGVVNG